MAASLCSRWMLGLIVGISLLGCDSTLPADNKSLVAKVTKQIELTPIQPIERTERPTEKSALRMARFANVAEALGVRFVYDNGASSKRLMVEATGGGCGWLDYDRDGWLDLYLSQGGVPDAPDPSSRPMDSLMRSVDGVAFTSVTASAGTTGQEYGQGVAVGDFNNDGFPDLLVTNVGQNHFYANQGDGTFRDLAESAGLIGRGWSASAAWADLDRDGDLDLYVCHYLDYDPYKPMPCLDKNGVPAICHPRNVEATPDECFENLGEGSFRAVAQEWGLFGPGNKALGVAIADFSGDDWPDIFVANDTMANFLFINQQGGGFKESAQVLGAALSMTGTTQANMGVAVGDYDQNGFPDLCVTHFTGEWATVYRNLGPQGFQDVSPLTGMHELTRTKLGFGTVMQDFNSDRRMDLFFTNGHIDPENSDGDGYEMSPQFVTFDRERWINQSATAGDFFSGRYVGRGVAAGDFDRDGDTDLAVVHQNSPAAILRNDSESGHWLRLKFVCTTSNRDGIGTRIVVSQGDSRLVGELVGGTSYASAHEPVLPFGLGDDDAPCVLEIRWPSGATQTISNVAVDQIYVLHEPIHDE